MGILISRKHELDDCPILWVFWIIFILFCRLRKMTSCQYEGYKDNANAMYISERRPIYINIYKYISFFSTGGKGFDKDI